MAKELKLPDLGENIDTATVLGVKVEKGQSLDIDDVVVEVETDKAILEVPSNIAGAIREIRIREGDEISPGDVILVVDESGEAEGAPADEGAKPDQKPSEAEDASPGQQEKEEEQPETEAAKEEPSAPAEKKERASVPQSARLGPKDAHVQAPERGGEKRPLVPASPSVRRFAREIGVDVTQVKGTQSGGRISHDDVKRHARERASGGGGGAAAGAIHLPDFEKWGSVRREKMSGIRRAIARNMALSWSNIPHVHHFSEADITRLEAMRREYNGFLDKGETPVTLTAIILRVAAHVLGEYPEINASLDTSSDEIVFKEYIHLGVAVDTPRGLVVPVVRDADRKSVREIADELGGMAGRARDGKLKPEEMEGSTFTISNLGGIGAVQFTPIINPPNVAILGVSRGQSRLQMVEDRPEERLILPLALGYDHRVIDGAQAARFMRDLAGYLANPVFTMFEL